MKQSPYAVIFAWPGYACFSLYYRPRNFSYTNAATVLVRAEFSLSGWLLNKKKPDKNNVQTQLLRLFLINRSWKVERHPNFQRFSEGWRCTETALRCQPVTRVIDATASAVSLIPPPGIKAAQGLSLETLSRHRIALCMLDTAGVASCANPAPPMRSCANGCP